ILSIHLCAAVLLDHPQSDEVHAPVPSGADGSLRLWIAGNVAALFGTGGFRGEEQGGPGVREEVDDRLRCSGGSSSPGLSDLRLIASRAGQAHWRRRLRAADGV